MRTLIRRRRIAADLARPRGAGERARAGLPDQPALLDWLWRHTAVPERRARVWVQWLHARLARLALEQAAAAAAEQARGPRRLRPQRLRLRSRLPPKAVRVKGSIHLFYFIPLACQRPCLDSHALASSTKHVLILATAAALWLTEALVQSWGPHALRVT